MSKYQFCVKCKHILTKMVNSVNDKNGYLHLAKVQEISCPARFNPYEGEWAVSEGDNPHKCPKHKKFMEMKRKELEAYILHHRWTI